MQVVAQHVVIPIQTGQAQYLVLLLLPYSYQGRPFDPMLTSAPSGVCWPCASQDTQFYIVKTSMPFSSTIKKSASSATSGLSFASFHLHELLQSFLLFSIDYLLFFSSPAFPPPSSNLPCLFCSYIPHQGTPLVPLTYKSALQSTCKKHTASP